MEQYPRCICGGYEQDLRKGQERWARRSKQTGNPGQSSPLFSSHGQRLMKQSLLDVSRESLNATLASIPAATSQSVFWAGYDTARLVHIEFWPLWQSSARNLKLGDNGLVISGGEGEIKCTSRRWVDIWGRRIDKVWEQAVGSARGLLISRPGLTEVSVPSGPRASGLMKCSASSGRSCAMLWTG
jgi:hypothetical protein